MRLTVNPRVRIIFDDEHRVHAFIRLANAADAGTEAWHPGYASIYHREILFRLNTLGSVLVERFISERDRAEVLDELDNLYQFMHGTRTADVRSASVALVDRLLDEEILIEVQEAGAAPLHLA